MEILNTNVTAHFIWLWQGVTSTELPSQQAKKCLLDNFTNSNLRKSHRRTPTILLLTARICIVLKWKSDRSNQLEFGYWIHENNLKPETDQTQHSKNLLLALLTVLFNLLTMCRMWHKNRSIYPLNELLICFTVYEWNTYLIIWNILKCDFKIWNFKTF